MAYRLSVHQSTGVIPSAMMIGSEIRLSIDLVFGRHEVTFLKKNMAYYSAFVNDLQEESSNIHKLARENLIVSAQTMKKNYDFKVNLYRYNVGDYVWYFNQKKRLA